MTSPLICQWCDGPVVEAHRDPEAVAWIGAGASTYCSTECMAAATEARVNAEPQDAL